MAIPIERAWSINGRSDIIFLRALTIFFALIAISANVSAQPDDTAPQEVGIPFPGGQEPKPFAGLTELNTTLDFSFMYTHLRGQDMAGSYGGVPQIGAGISFAFSQRNRFFMSLGYGHQSGDPYWDVDGFSNDGSITVQTIPLLLGLKTNASSRKTFRLYFGMAVQLTHVTEKISTGELNGDAQTISPSGLTTGYYLFFGPEFPLGKGTDALGMEFGIGGTKGSLNSGSYSHNIDLTGYSMRVYYNFGI